MRFSAPKSDGFSLISLLAGLAVVGIVSWLTLLALTNYRSSQLLKAGAEEVLSTLSAARAKTLAGINNSQYGVHFQNDRLVLFQGTTYPGTTIETIILDPAIIIATITFNGGGLDVIFNRLTGATGQTGSVTVRLAADAASARIIDIAPTGSAYLR